MSKDIAMGNIGDCREGAIGEIQIRTKIFGPRWIDYLSHALSCSKLLVV
jgi:hypothetical protein